MSKENIIVPAGKISSTKDQITLQLEIPGASKDNLDIIIENKLLRVEGQKQMPDFKNGWLHRERRMGKYVKEYTLEDEVDENSIKAAMDKGVLTLTVDIKEKAKPRKIAISG